MPYAKRNYHLHLAVQKKYRKTDKGKRSAKSYQDKVRTKLQELRKQRDPMYGVDYSR